MSDCENARTALASARETYNSRSSRLSTLREASGGVAQALTDARSQASTTQRAVDEAEAEVQRAASNIGTKSAMLQAKISARDAALQPAVAARSAYERAMSSGATQLEQDALYAVWKPLSMAADALIEEVQQTEREEYESQVAASEAAAWTHQNALTAHDTSREAVRTAEERKNEFERRVSEAKSEVESAQSAVEAAQFQVELSCP